MHRERVRVKICGITNQADAEAAIAAGADALGFNTWTGSKRYIDLEQNRSWLRDLPPFVTKVALLVNAPLSEAERIGRLPFIDALQLHGDEDAAYCAQVREFGKPHIKALRARSIDDFSQLSDFYTRVFLIDAHVAGLFGGTGVRVNLDLASEFSHRFPQYSLVLAGGLNAENITEAVQRIRPFAVDVSSGVEATPGRKDQDLMRAFVNGVRQAETIR